MVTMDIEITFAEPMLGTKPADPEAYEKYVRQSRPEGPAEDEEGGPQGGRPDERGPTVTVFDRLPDGRPFLWDYQIKGFFKDAAAAVRQFPGSRTAGVKAFRKAIDCAVFPVPRRIALELPEGGQAGRVARPLRAQTPRGERVAIACSESVPAGTRMRLRLAVMDPSLAPAVAEWLDYGVLRGIGQWRNSGAGRFSWRKLNPGNEK